MQPSRSTNQASQYTCAPIRRRTGLCSHVSDFNYRSYVGRNTCADDTVYKVLTSLSCHEWQQDDHREAWKKQTRSFQKNFELIVWLCAPRLNVKLKCYTLLKSSSNQKGVLLIVNIAWMFNIHCAERYLCYLSCFHIHLLKEERFSVFTSNLSLIWWHVTWEHDFVKSQQINPVGIFK